MIKTKATSGNVEFRPRARILKLIGAELISDDVVAVTELVKNAHDADASRVTITFKGVASGNGGEIIISDDGTGMDLDTLLGRWMEPAGSSKVGPDRKRTRKGRRALGEKGLGRFSADKLARNLELISRTKNSPDEIRAVFDWDLFDDDSLMLSDIKCSWELRRATIKPHGTILRMTGLRSSWTERMFRRLATRLSRLQTPFRELSDFSICIDSDEFPLYSGELRSEILDRAPYRIDATFDGKETISYRINGARETEQPWTESTPLKCGPVRVRIFGFDLETDAVAKLGPRMEVRAWLREWSGVSIYRDGFRIWPYGEPHDDWLRLDQRRVNNPVFRLSNNQVVGFVEITGDQNPGLVDQTNREGMINNRAFADLRRLMHVVLHQIETFRQTIRHPAQRGEASLDPGGGIGPGPDAPVVGAIEKLARKADAEMATELRRIADRVRESYAGRDSRHRKLLETYSGLAAVGQAAIVLARAQPLDAALERVKSGLQQARKHAAARNGLGTILGKLDQDVKALTSTLEIFGSVTDHNTKNRAIDIADELEVCYPLVRSILEARGAQLELKASGDVHRALIRPETFQRIILLLASVLLDDAQDRVNRVVTIRAGRRGEELCEVQMTAAGARPGIPDDFVATPFTPASGDGRHEIGIARDILVAHGGSLEVVRPRRGRGGGGGFAIVLPRKRARATADLQ